MSEFQNTLSPVACNQTAPKRDLDGVGKTRFFHERMIQVFLEDTSHQDKERGSIHMLLTGCCSLNSLDLC